MIYAIFGGLKAVAISDTVNGIGLLVGGLMIPFFGLLAVGNGSVLTGFDTLTTNLPDKFIAAGDSSASVPFATIFTGMMLVQLFYWGTNQAIIQRALGAKNLKEGQKGLLLAAVIKILGPLIVVLPGIIAFYLFSTEINKPDEAYPTLVREVLPNYLVGFFAAVLFGAILSSFNSALNSSVTLFGVDLYKEYINKEADESRIVKYGKIFGIVLAILSMCIAPLIANAPEGLFGYLQEVNGCYSIPILTIIIVGYLTKRVPAIAAKVALVSGVILYSISQFVMQPYYGKDNYPHFLHIMAILFLINVLIMLFIGRLYPRKVPYQQVYTHQVDIEPWKYTKPIGVIICLIVIFTYIYFQ